MQYNAIIRVAIRLKASRGRFRTSKNVKPNRFNVNVRLLFVVLLSDRVEKSRLREDASLVRFA